MTCTKRSRPPRLRPAILLALAAVLLPSAVCPAIARAANLAVSKDGEVIEIRPSGMTQSPARPASPEAARLGAPEYAGTQYYPPAGDHSAESVIGSDDRTQVTATTTFPNSAIVHLVIDFPTGTFVCSGWMIDTDRVATAGHCIYFFQNGGFADAITVYPGRNGASAPLGSFAATNWYVPHKWKKTQKPQFDYGVVKLGSNVGGTVGIFGFAAKDDAFLDKRKIKVRGYPADKTIGTMWTMNGRVKEFEPSRFFYGVDTAGGQSGSPVFGKDGACDPCSFGIHTYGVGGTWTKNSATRISTKVFDFLLQTGN